MFAGKAREDYQNLSWFSSTEEHLIIPAHMATSDAIDFRATHGRRLICFAPTQNRVDQLGLNLISRRNRSRHDTAFTTSIEAKNQVTTGNSAIDRASTILAAAVDRARLAGLNASGVICEIEDGA